jgi:hypothetical protein
VNFNELIKKLLLPVQQVQFVMRDISRGTEESVSTGGYNGKDGVHVQSCLISEFAVHGFAYSRLSSSQWYITMNFPVLHLCDLHIVS